MTVYNRNGVLSSSHPRSESGTLSTSADVLSSERGSFSSDPTNIKSSDAYITAYNLFKDLPDQYWMNQLTIICSQSPGDSTFWDEIGFSNNYDQAVRDLYNSQVTQIYNLVSEYQKYVQGLPTTQSQQFLDAGVNANITGQGLSSSNIDANPVSAPTLPDVTNPIEITSDFVGIANNIASIFSSISTIGVSKRAQKLSEKQFLNSAWKELFNAGFDVTGSDFNTLDDYSNFINSLAGSDPDKARKFKARVDWFKAYGEYAPYHSYETPYEYQQALHGEDFEKFYLSLADYQSQIKLIDLQEELAISNWNQSYYSKSDPESKALSENVINQFNRAKDSTQLSFVKEWTEQFNNTKDPVSKYCLLRTLFSLDLSEQSIMYMMEKMGNPTAVEVSRGTASIISKVADEGVSAIAKVATKGKINGNVKTK